MNETRCAECGMLLTLPQCRAGACAIVALQEEIDRLKGIIGEQADKLAEAGKEFGEQRREIDSLQAMLRKLATPRALRELDSVSYKLLGQMTNEKG